MLQTENGQIFYCLQNLLINASLAKLNLLSLSLSFLPSYLHQIFICGTFVLPQLQQFGNSPQKKLAQKEHIYCKWHEIETLKITKQG